MHSHCGLFGRCIAGKGFSGNIHYFYCVIAMGWIGFATCMTAVLMSGFRLDAVRPPPALADALSLLSVSTE